MSEAAGGGVRRWGPRREGGDVGGGGGGAAVGGVPERGVGVRGVQRGDRGGERRVRAAVRARVPLGMHPAVAPEAQHLPVLPVRAADRRRVLRDREGVEELSEDGEQQQQQR